MSTKNCEHCKVGFLDFTGVTLDATPPLYEHRCTACGKLAHERAMYEAPGQNAPAPATPVVDPMTELIGEIRNLIALIEKKRELPSVAISLTPYLLERILAGETVLRAVGFGDGQIQTFAISSATTPLIKAGPWWVVPPPVDAATKPFIEDKGIEDTDALL